MFKMKPKLLFFVLIFVMICGTLAALYSYDKTYTVYMAGNSHIDTAWQWTTTTTRNTYVPNTFTQAINLMNANADYTFNASAALHHEWVKNDNPALWNNIKTKVANGQWNLVGGEWVEADTNMSGGELLIRQHLHGQRFFQQNFNKLCTVGFLPDCFGFTAQLPQILKGCGMDYFVTTKLNWNDTNNFPHEIFKWNALDGSQVITYKPRQDYSAGTGSSADINYVLDEPNRHSIKKGLLLYGSGDAGGGPTQTNINNIRTYDGTSTMPNVKMYSVNKYFADLTTTDKNNITDSWTGYIPLEEHRGTYTSQAQIKKNNRKGEILVEEAEKFSSIAQWLGAKTYDTTNIFNALKLVMLNQFHDILPGSCTNNAAVEARNNGSSAINTLTSVLNSAVAAIATKVDTTVSRGGVPVVVFNPLSFGRRFPVQTNVTFSAAPTSLKVYDNGVEIPCQILSASGNTATIVFIVDNVPSLGYKVVEAVANTGNYAGANVMSIGNNIIHSDKFQVTISGTTGNISAILDKTNNRQVLSGEGNVFQILDDTPANWDAWNVDYDDMTRTPLSTMGSTTGINIVENGPAKCTYRINKSYGSSTFQIYVTLYATIDKIDIRVTGSWNESHKMLKTAFTWNVSGATNVMYDVAYGAVSRPNTMTQAQFEVPAHKWADISAGGYGVALLNDCKYGYDASGNRIRLSLLRSPKSPDAQCDMGTIPEFTYSIYPHSGDWRSANVQYKGWELNTPLIGYTTTAHTGTLGKSASFFGVNVGNVILSCVKKAEDSSDYILRAYQTDGSSVNATITCPGNITSISETDMLERNIGTPSYSGASFTSSFGAYKIKTFKVNFGGTVPPTPTPTPLPTPTPIGQSNVALYKAATANQYVANEGPEKAVDGSLAGYNSGNSKWCSTVSGDKWLRVDLGQNYNISRWVVYHAGAGGESTSWNTVDFKLQKSSDGTNWTDVDPVTGNIANSTDRTVPTFTSRYVRLYITNCGSDSAARIYEFEVYGVPSGATPTPTPVPSSFTDNFNDNILGSAWSFYSGAWSESGTILRQNSTTQGDPCKAIISNSGKNFGSNHTILAKVYVDIWTDGDSARAGVSLFTGTGDGRGYNLLFHNNHSTVQFLDDMTAWGPSFTFNWSNRVWYWFKLKMENGTLYGKVWQDGGVEPSNWPYTWTRSGRSGYPAFNGGTSGHGGSCTVFFDDVTVTVP